MKGIGLRDRVTVSSREFQIHTGNDPQKNVVLSEIFEEGKFLFSNEEPYTIREREEPTVEEDYLKSITYSQHKTAIDEIRNLFFINEKLKQIRQYLPHFRIGKVFLNRNFVGEAIDNLKRVVEYKPDFVRGHMKLGLAYLKAGDIELAIKSLIEAHKLNPQYPDVLNNLGAAYSINRNYAKASSFLKMALDVKPGYKTASFNLGIVLFLSTISDDDEDSHVAIPARFIRSFKDIIKKPENTLPHFVNAPVR